MSEEAIELNLNLKKLNKSVCMLCDHVENLRSGIEDLSEWFAEQESDGKEDLIDEEVIEAKRARSRSATGH